MVHLNFPKHHKNLDSSREKGEGKATDGIRDCRKGEVGDIKAKERNLICFLFNIKFHYLAILLGTTSILCSIYDDYSVKVQ